MSWSSPFAYVIRFRGNIHVTAADGETRDAAGWVGKGGRARKLRDAEVTAGRHKVGADVCVHARNMKEPWCLAASDGEASARTIMNYYPKRWTIEWAFRDSKSVQLEMRRSTCRRIGGRPSYQQVPTPREDLRQLFAAASIAIPTALPLAPRVATKQKLPQRRKRDHCFDPVKVVGGRACAQALYDTERSEIARHTALVRHHKDSPRQLKGGLRFFVLRRQWSAERRSQHRREYCARSVAGFGSIMFLDADNRVEKHFLSRALTALRAAPEDIGWVYPVVGMVGLTESWSMRGEFSLLTLLPHSIQTLTPYTSLITH